MQVPHGGTDEVQNHNLWQLQEHGMSIVFLEIPSYVSHSILFFVLQDVFFKPWP